MQRGRAGGAAAIGGFKFQYGVIAYVHAHMLARRRLNWIDDHAPDLPKRVLGETGGPGDDLRIETQHGRSIEVQVKKGLQRGGSLWDAVLSLASGLASDPDLFGVLAVDDGSSVSVRVELAKDLRRLGDGRNDDLRPITCELLKRLAAAKIDAPADVFRRLRIVTLSFGPAGNEGVLGRSLLSGVLGPENVETAWRLLLHDAESSGEERLSTDVQKLARLLGREGLSLQQTLSTKTDQPQTLSFPVIGRFVGRFEEQMTFRQAVMIAGTPRVLAVTGEGGIGKSELLHQFAVLTALQMPDATTISIDAPTIRSIADWARQFMTAPALQSDDLERDIATADRLRQSIEENLGYDRAHSGKGTTADTTRDVAEIAALEKRILLDLGLAIARSTERARPLVLFLDNCERRSASLQDVVRAFLETTRESNVLIVAAGRNIELTFDAPIGQLVLRELSPAEARQFLLERGDQDNSRLVQNADLREAVLQTMSGHPQFLSIAADVVAADETIQSEEFTSRGTAAARTRLIAEFLLPRYVRRIIETFPQLQDVAEDKLLLDLARLAVPRWLTADLAQALDAADVFRAIVHSADWVRAEAPDGDVVYRMRDRIRDLLIEAGGRENAETMLHAHQSAADWALAKITQSKLTLPMMLAHQFHLFHVNPALAQAYFERVYKPLSDDHNVRLCWLMVENIGGILMPSSPSYVWMLLRVGDYWRLRRNYAEAEKHYVRGLAVMDDAGDHEPKLRASLLNNLGIVRISTAEQKAIEQGIESLKAALHIARANNLVLLQALACCNRGLALGNLTIFAESKKKLSTLRAHSVAWYEKSSEICRTRLAAIARRLRAKNLKDDERDSLVPEQRMLQLTLAKNLQNTASLRIEGGKRREAKQAITKALTMYRRMKNDYGVASAIAVLADADPGRFPNRVDLHKMLAGEFDRLGDTVHAAQELLRAASALPLDGSAESWAALVTSAITATLSTADFHSHREIVAGIVGYWNTLAGRDAARAHALFELVFARLENDGAFNVMPPLRTFLLDASAQWKSPQAEV